MATNSFSISARDFTSDTGSLGKLGLTWGTSTCFYASNDGFTSDAVSTDYVTANGIYSCQTTQRLNTVLNGIPNDSYDVWVYGASWNSEPMSLRVNGGAFTPNVGITASVWTWNKIGTNISLRAGDKLDLQFYNPTYATYIKDVHFVKTGSTAPVFVPTGKEGYRRSENGYVVPACITKPSHLCDGQTSEFTVNPVFYGGASDFTYSFLVNGVLTYDYSATANTSVIQNLLFTDLVDGPNNVRVFCKSGSNEAYADYRIVKEVPQRTVVERTFISTEGGYTVDANVVSDLQGSKLIPGASNGIIITTDITNIDLSGYSTITGMDVTGQGAKFLVSYDDRQTWYTFENGIFVAVTPNNIASRGMLISTLKNITPTQWRTVFTRTKLDIMLDITPTYNGFGDRGTHTMSLNFNTLTPVQYPVHTWSDDNVTYVMTATYGGDYPGTMDVYLHTYTESTSTWKVPVKLLNANAFQPLIGAYCRWDYLAGNCSMWADSDYLYVIAYGYNGIIKVKRSDNTFTIKNDPGLALPRFVTGDATNLYISNQNASNIACVKRSDDTVTYIQTSSQLVPCNIWSDVKSVAVSNRSSNTVTILNKADRSMVNVNVGVTPAHIWGDATHIYVANSGAATVSRITRGINSVTTITVDGAPTYIWGDTTDVYVTTSTSMMSRIKRSTNEVTNIFIGNGPTWLIGTSTDMYTMCVNGTLACVSRADNSVSRQYTSVAPMQLSASSSNIYYVTGSWALIIPISNQDINRYYTSVSLGSPGPSITDDNYLYATTYINADAGNTLNVYDKVSMALVKSIPLSGGGVYAISQDATTIYLGLYYGNYYYAYSAYCTVKKNTWVVSPTTKIVDGTYMPNGNACSPQLLGTQGAVINDNTYMYLTTFESNCVYVISKSDLTYVRVATNIVVPTALYDSGDSIYAASLSGKYVFKIVKGTWTLLQANVVDTPLSITGDATSVYVTCTTGLSIVDKALGTVVSKPVSDVKGAVTWGVSNTKYAFMVSASKLWIYDKASATVSSVTIPMFLDVNTIRCLCDENYVYILNATTVSIYNIKTGIVYPYQFPVSSNLQTGYTDGASLFMSAVGTGLMYKVSLRSTPYVKSLSVVLPPNRPPVITNAGLTPNSFHVGTAVLTADIEDMEGAIAVYRVLINGVEYRTWSYPDSSTVKVNMDIPYVSLAAGLNSIRLEAKDSLNATSSIDMYLSLIDAATSISATFSRALLQFALSDADNDAIQYRVLINGVQKYPSNDWTTYEGVPVTLPFSKTDFNLAVSNTIQLEARDVAGVISTWSQSFIGSYVGLMLMDTTGGFYSDDLGNRLKYYDFGTITAGQTTLPTPLVIKNMTGIPVKDVTLTVIVPSLPAGTDVLVTSDSSGLLAAHTTTLPATMADGDTVEVYLIASSLVTTHVGGNFNVHVRAELA